MRTLVRQMDAYGKWVRPRSCRAPATPTCCRAQIYADNLKQFGVTMEPHELMDRALFAFAQTRDEMQALATADRPRSTAGRRRDYRDVIRELKKQRIPNDQAAGGLPRAPGQHREHHARAAAHHAPGAAAAIRLGTPAENAALPAPHLSLPRLLGNTGE